MPRPTHKPLTDRAIRATTPGPTPIDLRDGELRGLILTVHPSGKRQWTIRYIPSSGDVAGPGLTVDLGGAFGVTS